VNRDLKTRLVQLKKGPVRRIALVEEPHLRVLGWLLVCLRTCEIGDPDWIDSAISCRRGSHTGTPDYDLYSGKVRVAVVAAD
jgi:hypothetical protein